MMKKVLLVAFVILIMGVSAHAGLIIVIQNDAGQWVEYADSTFTITPSTEVVYGVINDGQTQIGTFALGLLSGPGSLRENINILSEGVTAALTDDVMKAARLGVQNQFVSMSVLNPTDGLLFTNTFHCEGEGDVTLAIVGEDGLVVDTQVIHQIPEPASLALLGLGGFLLRRRRSA